MKKNDQSSQTAKGGFMDRWSLMEAGRKLHDKAVFDIFAALLARVSSSQKGHQMARQAPALTPSLANHRPH
jgi:hypothetical protein